MIFSLITWLKQYLLDLSIIFCLYKYQVIYWMINVNILFTDILSCSGIYNCYLAEIVSWRLGDLVRVLYKFLL